jgi:hypothetical protein
MAKLNNGYVIVATSVIQGAPEKVYGPFVTPIDAMTSFLTCWKLQSKQVKEEQDHAREYNRPFRPIISRDYYLTPQTDRDLKDRFYRFRIETLEILNVFS